jgi:hypothetical protein
MTGEILTEDGWREVDEELFLGHRLAALKLIRERSGLRLAQASELMYERYRELRAEYPERFTCGDEEYWAGWYS